MNICRYLICEIFFYLMLFFTALFIALLGNYIGSFLNMAANGYMGLSTVFKLLLFISPNLVLLLLPMSVFAGIFTAFRQFAVNNELVTLFSCGVTWKRLFCYALIPVLILTAITLLLSFVVVPKSLADFERLSHQTALKSIQYLQPQKFYHLNKNKEVFLDDKKGVFLISSHQNHITLMHASNYILNNHLLMMGDGWRDILSQSNEAIKKLTFKGGVFNMGVKETGLHFSMATIGTIELLSKHDVKSELELRWRLYTGLLPLTTLFFVFPFCAGLMKKKNPLNIILAIVAFVSFCVLSSVLKNMLLTRELPYWLGFEILSFVAFIFGASWIFIMDGR